MPSAFLQASSSATQTLAHRKSELGSRFDGIGSNNRRARTNLAGLLRKLNPSKATELTFDVKTLAVHKPFLLQG